MKISAIMQKIYGKNNRIKYYSSSALLVVTFFMLISFSMIGIGKEQSNFFQQQVQLLYQQIQAKKPSYQQQLQQRTFAPDVCTGSVSDRVSPDDFDGDGILDVDEGMDCSNQVQLITGGSHSGWSPSPTGNDPRASTNFNNGQFSGTVYADGPWNGTTRATWGGLTPGVETSYQVNLNQAGHRTNPLILRGTLSGPNYNGSWWSGGGNWGGHGTTIVTFTPSSSSFTVSVNMAAPGATAGDLGWWVGNVRQSDLTILCEGTDSDGDGVPDYIDRDSDNDGILDIDEGTGDDDGDGIPNFQDLDADGDGIPDVVESGLADLDENGQVDGGVTSCGAPLNANGGEGISPIDSDNDGIDNHLDLDSDNDGVPDAEEGYTDVDGDGTLNFLDLDADGDGCYDIFESAASTSNTDSIFRTPIIFGTNGLANTLEDSDDLTARINYTSTYRIFGTHAQVNGCDDFDNDGILDVADIDDDNDGILDSIEMTCATNPLPIDKSQLLASSHLNFQTGDSTNLIDGLETNGAYFVNNQDIAGKSIFEFSLSSASVLQRIDVTTNSTASFLRIHATVKVQGWDGTAWVDVSSTLTSDGTSEASTIANGSSYAVPFNFPTNSIAFDKYRIFGLSGKTSTAYPREVHFLVGCSNFDSDNDGQPNYKDLDSDGDGCYDIAEAGAGQIGDSLVTQSLSFTDVGNNGFADHLETSTDSNVPNYNSTSYMALTNLLNACADTDNDGVGDLIDLDDDNDGIRDSDEAPDCFFTQSDLEAGNRSAFVTIQTDLNMTSPYVNPEKLVDSLSGTSGAEYAVNFVNGQPIANKVIYQFDFANPINLKTIYLQYINANSHFINGAVAKLQGSNDGNTWTDLNTGTTYNQANLNTAILSYGTLRNHPFTTTQNANTYRKYRIYGVSGTSWSGGYSNEVYFEINNFRPEDFPKTSCNADTDGDGIYNHLDLDSDGDNCPDAVEAGAVTNTTDSVVITIGSTAVGTNGLADIIEISPDSDSVNYESTYNDYALLNHLSVCADTDEDGIGDLIDIDDDNDGIPDIDELFCNAAGSQDMSDLTFTGGNVVLTASDATYLNLTGGTCWNTTYSDQTFELPIHLEYRTPTLGNSAMFGLIPVNATKTNSNWNDGGYKFYHAGATTYGYFPTAWTFTLTGVANELYEIDIDVNGMVTVTVGGTVRRTFQGTTSDYLLDVSYCAASSFIDLELTAANIQGSPNDCAPVDTDMDGIANHLDRDSDGDGCFDAYEAGAVNNPNDSVVIPIGSTAVGLNGLADIVETSPDNATLNYNATYLQYAAVDFLNACADSDNDNIPDLVDIDDDNDGIRDSDEAPDCFTKFLEINYYNGDRSNELTINSDLTFQVGNPDLLINGVYGNQVLPTNGQPLLNKTILEITPQLSVELEEIIITMNNATQTFFNNGAVVKVQGFDGVNWVDLSDNTTYGTTSGTATTIAGATGQIAFPITKNQNRYVSYRLRGQAGTVRNTYYLQDIHLNIVNFRPEDYPKTSCNADTDGDGIYNHLDLDADGDGCYDIVEAGVSFIGDSLVTQNPNFISVGTNGLADNLELSADTNIINYTLFNYYLDNAQNACADHDGDLVGDLIDIDDDNDGVLDTEEIICNALQNRISEVNTQNGNGTGEHVTLLKYELGTDSMVLNFNLTANTSYYYTNDGLEDGAWNFVGYNTLVGSKEDYQFIMPVNNFINGAIKWGPNIGVNTNSSYNSSTSALDLTLNWNGSVIATMYDPNNQTDIADGAIITSGTTINRKSGAIQTRTWYLIFDFKDHIGDFNFTVDYLTVPSWFGNGIDFSELTACAELDTDNDNIPNRLDLDSDGDGCYDAKEANVTGATNNGSVTDSLIETLSVLVGRNGLANSIETNDSDTAATTYTSTYYIATSNILDACADTDMDGIGDLIDIDDDNDGTLDIDEYNCEAVTFSNGVASGAANARVVTGIFSNSLDTANYRFTSDANNGTFYTNFTNGFHYSAYDNLAPFDVNETHELTIYTGTFMEGVIEWGPQVPTNTSSWANQTVNPHEITLSWSPTVKATLIDPDNQTSVWNEALDGSGVTFSANIGTTNSRTWKIQFEVDGTFTDFKLEVKHERDLLIGYHGYGFNLIGGLCQTQDTDMDGIPNHLDLDSDADGCSDAYEAGAVNNITDSLVIPVGSTLVGVNGLADAIETTTDNGVLNYGSNYNRYAIVDFLNACADTDDDGINDLVDIDDDNDGIRDSEEAPNCFYPMDSVNFYTGDRSSMMTISSDLTFQVGNPELLINGIYGNQVLPTNGQPLLNEAIIEILTNQPVEVDAIIITMNNTAQTFFNNGATVKVQGFDGVDWIDLSSTLTYNTNSGTATTITGATGQISFPVENNQGMYRGYRILGQAGTVRNTYYLQDVHLNMVNFKPENYPKASCDADTDGDGIYNHLDLDSDGDGCFDAIEAGSVMNTTDSLVIPAGSTAVGQNGLADIIETSTDSDSINYESTYNNYAIFDHLIVCADTDDDGIGDLTDIDDDNDGIPDAIELKCEVAGGFDLTMATWTGGNVTEVTPDATSLTLSTGTCWATTYSDQTFALPIHLEYRTTNLSNSAMFGLLPVNATRTNTNWNDGSYKFYHAGATIYGYFPTAWTFTLTGVANELYEIDIDENGMVTTTVGGVVRNTFQGTVSDYVLSASYCAASSFIDLQLTAGNLSSSANDCAPIDTDGDGKYDHVDLDSDGDGCYDIVEAGAGFIGDSIVNQNADFVSVGANGLANNLETNNDSDSLGYTLFYFFEDSLQNACNDHDGDLVGDLIDIDDDNDGILDTDEVLCGGDLTIQNGVASGAANNRIVNAQFSDGTDTLFYQFGTNTDNGTFYTNFTDGFHYATYDGTAPFEIRDTHSLSLPSNYIYNGTLDWGPEVPTNSSSWANQNVVAHDITLTWTPNVPAIVTNPSGQTTLTDGAIINSGITFTQNAGTTNSRDWKITFQTEGAATDFQLMVTHNHTALIGYHGYGFNIKGGICHILDTDNDGIPNSLDLDSDGDGCFDAYESGVTGATNDGSITDSLIATTNAQVGLNGLANSIETNDLNTANTTYISTYTNYAVVDFLNACADSDNDGIGDLVDIDDDNDGIRDAVEAPDCFKSAIDFQSGDRSDFVTISTDLNMVATYSHPEELVDADNGTAAASYAVQMVNSQALTNQSVFQFDFELPVNLKTIYLQYVNGNSHFINGARAKLQGSNDASNWTDLSADIVYNQANLSTPVLNIGTIRNHQFTVTQNANSYKYYRIYGVSGTIWSGGYSNEVYFEFNDFRREDFPKTSCTADIDGDGIYNHLDLDSDGDGCYDLAEAGAGAVGDSLVSQNPAYTDVSNNGFADHLETNIDSDSINYSYQLFAYNALLDACLDSDNDGVGDLIDIDDDNDGVPDSYEITCNNLGTRISETNTQNGNGTGEHATLIKYEMGTDSMVLDFNLTANTSYYYTNDGLEDGAWNFVGYNTVVGSKEDYKFTMPVDHIIGGQLLWGPNIGTNTNTNYNSSSSVNDLELNWMGNVTATMFDPDNQTDIEDGAMVNSGSVINRKSGAIQTRTWYLIFNFNNHIGDFNFTVEYQTVPSWFGNGIDFSGLTACIDKDTDMDGTPDRLDLDSDGDGCYDVYEAQVTGSTFDGSVTDSLIATTNAQVGLNGLANSIESSTDSDTINYAIIYKYVTSDFLNFCADTDNDGIPDLVDIDDDNDGIMDAIESPDCYFTEKEISITNITSTLSNWNASYPFTQLYDGNLTSFGAYGALSTAISGETIFEIELTAPIELNGFDIVFNYSIFRTSGTTFKWQGYNGVSWVDVTDVLNETETTNNTYTYDFDRNLGAYQKYRLLGVSGTTYYARIYEIIPKIGSFVAELFPRDSCSSDIDGDGIYNHLDLDSDGDGCYDLVEAGAGAIGDSLVSQNPTYTDVSDNGFADHLETSTDSDSINFTLFNYWQSPILNACIDSDNDDVGDLIDIDDDNDGVLDIEEIACSGLLERGEEINTQNGNGTGMHTTKIKYGLGTDSMTLDVALIANQTYYYTNDGLEEGAFNFVSYNTVVGSQEQYNFTMPNLHLIEGTIKWGPNIGTNTNSNYNSSSSALDLELTWNGSVTATMFDPNNQTDVADGEIVTSGTVINRKSGAIQTRTWYLIFDFSTHVGNFNFTVDYQSVPSWFGNGIDFSGLTACTEKDTDLDGIPNRIDLDSDGDGCYDAYESGVTGATNDGSLTDSLIATTNAQVGLNGLANSNETNDTDTAAVTYTSTYINFAEVDFLNACADTDGDGIMDLVDIDDDNDGVRDSEEAPDCFYQTPENAIQIVEVTSELNIEAVSRPFTNAFDGIVSTASYTGFAPNQNHVDKSIYEITLSAPIAVHSIDFRMYNLAFTNGAANTNKLQGWTGTVWEDLDAAANRTVVNNTQTFTNSLQPNKKYGKYRIVGVAGVTYYARVYEIEMNYSGFRPEEFPKMACNADTDGDGIYNHLDLDSDGDGCYDLAEAGAGIVGDSVVTQNPSFISVGLNGLADNLETTADNDTINYTSKYYQAVTNLLNACADTDNDGIGDLNDIDDDNDGILDDIELACGDATFKNGTNFNFVNLAQTASGQFVSGDFSANYSLEMDAQLGTTTYYKVDSTDGFHFTIYDNDGGYIEKHTLSPQEDAVLKRVLYGPQVPKNNAVNNGQTNTAHTMTVSWTPAINAIIHVGTPAQITSHTDGDAISSGVEITNANYVINAGDWHIEFLADNLPLDFELTVEHTGTGMTYEGYGINASLCGAVDTDMDGIPNNLDLDSDNDGCYDAYESGVTGATNNGSITDSLIATTNIQVGLNGLANSIETNDTDTAAVTYISTYNNYATVDFLNACADSDNDGINDLIDIDDDNDGIRDSEEAPDCFYQNPENAIQIIEVTSELNIEAVGRPFTNAFDGIVSTASYTGFAPNQNHVDKSIYEITLSAPIAVSSIDFRMYNLAFTNGAANTNKLQGWTGTAWEDLDAAANRTVVNNTQTFTNSLQPNKKYGKYRIVGVAGVTYYARVYEIEMNYSGFRPEDFPKMACNADTDGDGIYNHLDLDSDGDGCYDLAEAGAGIVGDSVVTQNPSYVSVGLNGLADNLETTADNDSINYTNTYYLAITDVLNACADFDNDGVGDLVDIDDDNDGVPDVTELGCGNGKATTSTFNLPIGNQLIEGTYAKGDALANYSIDLSDASVALVAANNYDGNGLHYIFNDATRDFTSALTISPQTNTLLNTVKWGPNLNNNTDSENINIAQSINLSWTPNVTATVIDPDNQLDLADGTIISSGQTIVQAATYTAAAKPTWSITFNTNLLVSDFVLTTNHISASNMGSEGYDLNVDICYLENTDGDAFANHLDLDSDDDGCFDIVESGAGLIGDSLVTQSGDYTSVGLNGLADNLETSADNATISYTSKYYMALTSLLNACADSDGDGIGDLIDIDDDNDGLLDDTELGCGSALFSNGDNFNFVNLAQTAGGQFETGLFKANYSLEMDAQLGTTTYFKVDSTDGFHYTIYDNDGGYTETHTLSPQGSTVLNRVFYGPQVSSNNAGNNGQSNTAQNMLITWTPAVNAILHVGTPAQVTSHVDGDLLNSGVSLNTSTYVINAGDWYIEFLTDKLPLDFELTVEHIGAGMTYEGYGINTSICGAIDTDNDGIANSLDLDSDNDGCYDISEAGAGFIGDSLVTQSPFYATVGLNGFADHLETSSDDGIINYAYYPYAYDTLANACIDFDMDGIGDLIDIDDDNDGIPDTVEDTEVCNFTTGGNFYFDQQIENGNVGWIHCSGSPDPPANRLWGSSVLPYDGNNQVGFHEPEIFTLQLPTPMVAGQDFVFSVATAVGSITPWSSNFPAYMRVYASNSTCTQTQLLGRTTTRPNQAAGWLLEDLIFTPNANYQYLTLVAESDQASGWQPGATGYLQVDYINFQPLNINNINPCDTMFINDFDRDGIINSLDLDSDGDGCSDASEAGSLASTTDSIVTGPYGLNGLANSLETDDTDTASINYTSYYNAFALDSLLNSCNDFDGDGIGDVIDIDDDNDGIPDATELGCGNGKATTTTFNLPIGSQLIEGVYTNDSAKANYSIDLSDASVALVAANNYQGNGLHYIFNDATTNFTSTLTVSPQINTLLSRIKWGPDLNGNTDSENINIAQSITLNWTPNFNATVIDPDNQLNIADGTLINAGQTIVQAATYTAAAKPTWYIVFNTSLSTSDFVLTTNHVSSSNMGSEGYDLNAELCFLENTDGDAFPNYLDLDSDNDGCSDLAESGAGSVTDSLVTQNGDFVSVGLNGLADNLETNDLTSADVVYFSTYYLATSDLLNACADFDGDGIGDLIDIDDDNDGIPDDIELSCAATEATINSTINTAQMQNIQGVFKAENDSATINIDFLDVENTTLQTMDLDGIHYIIYDNSNGNFTIEHTITPQDSALINKVLWGPNVPTNSNAQRASNNEIQDMVLTWSPNVTAIIHDEVGQLKNVVDGDIITSGTTISTCTAIPIMDAMWYIEFRANKLNAPFVLTTEHTTITGNHTYEGYGINVELCGIEDLDGDGKPNHLDLDSDGDGCPDAVESGATLVKTDSLFTGNVGLNGLDNSLETVADTGIINYNLRRTLNDSLDFLSTTINVCNLEVNCADGLDDDGDGLIDLNDPDCICNSADLFDTKPVSFFPNPSFEERTCCPSSFSQLNCAVAWAQATGATSDYLNTCNFSGFAGGIGVVPTPFPDGDGAIGTIKLAGTTYSEYVGACFPEPLTGGTSYTLDFWASAAGTEDVFGGDTKGDVVILGIPNCVSFPIPGTDSKEDNYTVLGRVPVDLKGGGAYKKYRIAFTVDQDYFTILIGSGDNMSIQAGESGNYVVYDDLTLNETDAYVANITQAGGTICEGDLKLLSPPVNEANGPYTYQWFKNGIAIPGATDTTYTVGAIEHGEYVIQVMGSVGCELSNILTVERCEFDPPFLIPNPLTIPQDSTGEVCMPVFDPNEGDTLTATLCGMEHGTATQTLINNQLCIKYTPDTGFSGTDNICVIVCDQTDRCDTTFVPVTVIAPLIPTTTPTPPIVIPTQITIPKDSTGTICTPILGANSNDAFTANLCVGSPANGTATPTIMGNSLCLTYQPDAGYVGIEPVCVIVCDLDGLCDTVDITVKVIPTPAPYDSIQPPIIVLPPIVTKMDSTATNCGPIIDVNFLDTHTVSICELPRNGTVTPIVDNDSKTLCLTYAPNSGFVGTDSVCLILCDQTGLCDTIQVPLIVLPSEGINNPPLVIPNPLTIKQDSTGNICVPIIDPDAGDMFTSMLCGVNNGSATGTVVNNQLCLEYTPDTGFSGLDSICVIVCDQVGACDTTAIPVTVLAPLVPKIIPTPPMVIPQIITVPQDSTGMVCSIVLDENIGDVFTVNLCTGSPENGMATPTITGDQLCIEYTPNTSYSGTDGVCVIVCDQLGLCDTVTFPVAVIPTPAPPDSLQAPIVVIPAIVTPEDSTTTSCGTVIDANMGDTHTVNICGPAQYGSATVALDNNNNQVCVTYDPIPGYEGADSICLEVCDQTGLCDTVIVPIVVVPRAIQLKLKVMLQGALISTLNPSQANADGMMRDDLRQNGYLPLSQPYVGPMNAFGRFEHHESGTEWTTQAVLDANAGTGDAIVDWVFIEIRDSADHSTLLRTIPALVQRDADIVAPYDGGDLWVTGLPKAFYISIKHRNHLGAMTADPMLVHSNTCEADFTTMTPSDFFAHDGYENLSVKTVGGMQALHAGNANSDNKVKYDGPSNDQLVILSEVILHPDNSSRIFNFGNAGGYHRGDINMDGIVKYDGARNDRFVNQFIIFFYPLNSTRLNNYNNMIEQIP